MGTLIKNVTTDATKTTPDLLRTGVMLGESFAAGECGLVARSAAAALSDG